MIFLSTLPTCDGNIWNIHHTDRSTVCCKENLRREKTEKKMEVSEFKSIETVAVFTTTEINHE